MCNTLNIPHYIIYILHSIFSLQNTYICYCHCVSPPTAISQLMKIFPKAFGYNERALLDLADHAYSCRFLTLALTMRTPAGS